MNILSIDYGSKNIGLAWCDDALGVVLPYGNMEHGTWNTELVKLITQEKIDKVIVGLPLGLDGKENENTKRVRKFVDELKKEISIPIDFIDERFTSAQADRMDPPSSANRRTTARQRPPSPRKGFGEAKGGASRDEKSAMIILQSYMDRI